MNTSPKFLGIKVSGRKNANTAILLNELVRPAQEKGYEVEILDLKKYKISHCTGCFACNNKDLKCVLQDDLEEIQAKILAANAIALASPCYAIGAPSILKTIADRSATWGLTRIINNNGQKKFGACVSVGGGEADWVSLQRVLPGLFLGLCDAEIVGQFTIKETAIRGEVLLSPSMLKKVGELGDRLVKSVEQQQCLKYDFTETENRLVCPNCYSDVFQVGKSGQYTCAVCCIEIKKYRKLSEQLNQYRNQPREFGSSRFTRQGAQSHIDHIGNKMINSMDASEEVNRRLELYFEQNIVPTADYKSPPQRTQTLKELGWENDALAAFEKLVPAIFYPMVKKAIEKKALDKGATVITKELFLQIKKESGF